jgi:hypothetical protein
MDWLVEDHGCTQRMAYLLLEVNPDFHVNVYQMALIGKLQYTVGAEILRTSLPPGRSYHGRGARQAHIVVGPLCERRTC